MRTRYAVRAASSSNGAATIPIPPAGTAVAAIASKRCGSYPGRTIPDALWTVAWRGRTIPACTVDRSLGNQVGRYQLVADYIHNL